MTQTANPPSAESPTATGTAGVVGGLRETFSEGLETGRAWALPAYFWCILIGLALNMFSGYWGLMGIPIPIDRVLILGGLLLAALDRNVRFASKLRWRTLHTLMLLFTLWTIYSALAANTMWTEDGFYALLDRIIMPFVLFSLAPVLFAGEQRRDLLWKMLAVVGLYLSVLAVFEMTPLSGLVWPKYIMNPYVGILFGRARGPFVAAEADGMVLILSMLACGFLYAKSTGFWRRYSMFVGPFCALASVLTMTRSIWLALMIAIGICVWMYPRLRRLAPRMIAVGLAAAALVLAISPIRDALIERLTTERSVYDRQNTNAAAVRILESRPMDGIGWHSFITEGAPVWVRQADTYPITNVGIEVHNVVLSRAAELGIPAALIWVIIVLLGPGQSVWAKQRGAMADFRVFGIATWAVWIFPTMLSPNPYPMPNYLFWIITGILAYRYLLKPPPQGLRNARQRQTGGQGPRPTTA